MRLNLTLASLGTAAVLLAFPFTAAQANYSQVIAFGDSLSDNGNVFGLTKSVLGLGIPAAPYFNGRFSTGPVAVEVMAQHLGVPLVDHAYGGALTGQGNRIDAGGLLDHTGLQGQIDQFSQDLSAQGRSADASALYFLWGGANDFFSSSDPVSTAATVIANLTHQVGQLYGLGARDFFVPLLPDMAYTADKIAAGPAAQAQAHQFTQSFNSGLSKALQAVGGGLSGATVHIFDPNPLLVDVRASLAAQGGNLTDPCWSGNYLGTGGTLCADPSRYFLWDHVHPTALVHDAVGRAMASAVPEPAAAALALVGLLTMGLARRRQSH